MNTQLTDCQKTKLKEARAKLCEFQDSVSPLSEEWQKVMEILEKVEKLMGII